jgi:hypothetical protein
MSKTQRRVALGALGALVCAGLIFFAFGLTTKGPEHVGDYLSGTAGSLWSLAGLALIYLAFLSQQREINLLEWQIRQQKKQVERQTSHLNRQNFENTFFEILRLHRNLAERIDDSDALSSEQGTYEQLAGGLKDHYLRQMLEANDVDLDDYKLTRENLLNGKIGVSSTNSVSERLTEWKDVWDFSEGKHDPFSLAAETMCHQLRFDQLRTYFSSLRNVIDFISKSTPDLNEDSQAERLRYARFVSTQMTKPELLLLYYYGFTAEGDDLGRTAADFQMFEILPTENLIEEAHASFYDPS